MIYELLHFISFGFSHSGGSPWSSATAGMNSFVRRIASVILAQVICIPFVKRPFQVEGEDLLQDEHTCLNVFLSRIWHIQRPPTTCRGRSTSGYRCCGVAVEMPTR